MCRDECLDRDPDDDKGGRQGKQAGAEPDRQLIDADAEAQVDDRKSSGVRQEAQAPVCGFLIVAGTQQEQARQEQKRDAGPTCGRPDQRADCPPNKHAGDGHAGLKEREDQGDAQPISSLESRDAERGAQGEGVEGEGEEKSGRDQELAHRVSELNKLPCTSNARSVY